jgi:hypothetical protein
MTPRPHIVSQDIAPRSRTLRAHQALQPKSLPATRTSDRNWVLIEEGFTLAREHEVESLFAIGNGYVGARASLAEGCVLSAPATSVAGAFEAEDGSTPGLARMADWTRLSISRSLSDPARWPRKSCAPPARPERA